MISPGFPTAETSGVGVAIERISGELAKKVALTVIQPEDVNTEEQIKAQQFDDHSVVRDITRIEISGNISPYLYEDDTVKVEKKSSKVQEELSVFTEGVVTQVKALDFDVIYAHDWVSFQAALKIKATSKKQLVLHVHSLDVDRISSVNHSWIFDVEREAFEQADLILSVSKYTAKRIEQHYGIHPRKIKVVYHGVDTPAAPDYQKKFDEPSVLFAGRLTGQKGTKEFAAIAEKVLKKNPKVRFIVAGDGDMRNDLLETTAHKGIGDRIHFTGYLDREGMDKVYAEATVLCMPSRSELFGLVALEAAAAKLPVVVSEQSGVIEVLPNTLQADPSDIEGFAKHILTAIDEKASM